MYRKMQRQSVEVRLGERDGERDDVPLVLFVCVHNAGRSRMAETFFEDLARGRYRAESAGTIPAPAPHPEVVQAMNDVGLPITDGPGRELTQELTEEAHLVIGMGCDVEEACPALSVPLEDWELDDPKGKSPEEVAEIRDQIELKVRNLIGRLDREIV